MRAGATPRVGIGLQRNWQTPKAIPRSLVGARRPVLRPPLEVVGLIAVGPTAFGSPLDMEFTRPLARYELLTCSIEAE